MDSTTLLIGSIYPHRSISLIDLERETISNYIRGSNTHPVAMDEKTICFSDKERLSVYDRRSSRTVLSLANNPNIRHLDTCFRLSNNELMFSYDYSGDCWWTDIRREGSVERKIPGLDKLVSGTLLSGRKIAVSGNKQEEDKKYIYSVYIGEM